MNFKKNRYLKIEKALSQEMCDFSYKYLLFKRQVADTLFKHKYISPYEQMWGVWSDPQIPNTYTIYSDLVMDTLLVKMLPLMEAATKSKLVPTYSYTRLYKRGDELKRHKDRFSCEMSATLNLGGDHWPIYLSPKENVGEPNGKNITTASKAKGIKIDLKPGDMLVYKGCDLEHWREPFEGDHCGQVFLHYNKKSQTNKDNMFDGRPHLGLPNWFKGKKLIE